MELKIKDNLLYIFILLSFIIITTWVFFLAFTENRDFKLIAVADTKACLLSDIRYQFEIRPKYFKYFGKKNSGLMSLRNGKIGDDMTKVVINNLEAGYKKIKNKRIYEYQISENIVLRDEFVFAKKSPLNLVPYLKECEVFKKKYPVHIKILENML